MKYFRRLGAFMLAGSIFCGAKLDCLAVQYNYRPLEAIPSNGDPSNYIALEVESEPYVVKPGDSLWGISRKVWGTGTRYEEIYQENRDVILDIQLIRPGDRLVIPQKLYVPKDRFDRGGLVSEGAFHIALPDMVEHDFFLTSEIDDVSFYGSDICIFSLPVKNQMGENALTASEEDWEAFMAEVIRCSETCGGRVSNLQFERYKVENGCDLCGYSFDFDTGDKIMEYVMFCRLGKRNMAEVIGVRGREQGEAKNTRLIDVARYIAASFEDFGGKIGMGFTKGTDNVGAYDWNYPELHNLFTSAMQNYVVYAERPDKNYPGDHEVIWAEPKFEQAVRSILTQLWQLGEEEEAEFLARPIMASDMAVITNVQCTLYRPGQRYADEDPAADGGPVLCLSCNGCSEKIYPGKDITFSYEDLGHFKEAKVLEMYSCDLTNYDFIAGMTHLKKLCLIAGETVENIDFLSGLEELRTLQLLGTFSYEEGEPTGFLEIKDLSVLKNCKELRYLFLRTPQVTDFSFLEECPEICTMNLSGEWKGQEPVIPDLALLPNARFLEFYDESYRFEP